jgi:hypothetical protein
MAELQAMCDQPSPAGMIKKQVRLRGGNLDAAGVVLLQTI